MILFAVLIHSYRGFNFGIPEQVFKDQQNFFLWSMNSSEIRTSGPNFVVFLIKPPDKFDCPTTDITNALGANRNSLIEQYTVLKTPQNDYSTGQVVFEPRSGNHSLCAYGYQEHNMTEFFGELMNDLYRNFLDPQPNGKSESTGSPKDLNLGNFEHLIFLNESHTFSVHGSHPTSVPTASITPSPSPRDSQCKENDHGYVTMLSTKSLLRVR
ncbi:hypothetical protein PM082_014935 [Marasmius tenuissimus]|nr:hypothetical protein PM082_014935 [Marasmius tenuissimus]